MKYLPTIRTAYRALTANLGRSLLTILGIVIGIVSIVLVIALGQGAQDLILGEIEGFGGNLIVVRPGRQPEGPTDFADTILADSIRDRDVEALRQAVNVPGAAEIHPALLVSGTVSYEDRVYRPLSFGWTSDGMVNFFDIFPSEGDFFTEDDIRQRAKVVVIGHTVKEELFGDSDALGEFIRIRDQNFRVIGLFPQSGQTSLFNVDEIVLLPYTTAQKDLLGISHYHEVLVQAADGADPNTVAEDVRATLRDLHGIDDPSKDDFFVLTQQNIADQIGTITTTLTIFLVAIASIALVVGGVGIMNIMLVSVTERTREVGLRKAVGATNQDIMQQFLAEAVILTGAGGILGTVVALLLAYGAAAILRSQFGLPWLVQLPVGAIFLGVGVAVTIGVVFGIYPARKAAKMDPIEALRYE